MPKYNELVIKFIDGILDGAEITLKKQAEPTILAIEPIGGNIDAYQYFHWENNIFIPYGKGNNVHRIVTKEHGFNGNQGIIPLKNKKGLQEQAEELLKTDLGEHTKYQLLNYRFHHKDIHTDVEDKTIIMGVFDFYIYDQVEIE